jgi:hypothetical protein
MLPSRLRRVPAHPGPDGGLPRRIGLRVTAGLRLVRRGARPAGRRRRPLKP